MDLNNDDWGYRNMDLNLSGKVAVICGGSTGIGEACAQIFAREGCKVAVCSRNKEKLKGFQERFVAQGYTALIRQCNCTDQEQVEAFAAEVYEQFGRIDIWINSAGGNRHMPLCDVTQDDYKYILDMNFSSTLYGINAASKYMKQTGGGSIVNISSASAETPAVYRLLYGAFKAAVSKLTQGVAAELAPFHIRVNAVEPGIINTILSRDAIVNHTESTMKKIALKRAGEPEEVAAPIVFLASDLASYITGASLAINGGKGLVGDPDLAWQGFHPTSMPPQ
ncbi:SDR family NAD(P)-dependent oxidoreductase [Anaerolentibacter hominis]|uniref:SDR family NAD(P)-dependent oxidoreductase n=1 Tax=Anaerolentibacter hominis TaxID=3079009 RepID=UPI0031B8A40B